MLGLGIFEMCPLMLNLFLTGVSVAEVCFLCLKVTCYKWRIIEDMMLFCFCFIPQEEHFCLILQLSRFGFQSEFFHVYVLQTDL